MKVILRYFKKTTKVGNIAIPKQILNIIGTNSFYVELLEDKTIRLVPVNKRK